jgi:hypothetical protein
VNVRSKDGVVLCLLCSLELHAAAFAVLTRGPRAPGGAPAGVDTQITIEEAPDPPVPTAFEPEQGGASPGVVAQVRYVVVRTEPRLPKEPVAPAAAGSAQVAAGGEVAVAVAPRGATYVGGVTSTEHGGELYSDEESGFGGSDLSTPAHLQGRVNWECRVRGAPMMAQVHVRVLVGADGTAERVEPFDRGEASEAILEAALPCALKQRYVSGTDGHGRVVKKWSRPFRVVVTGLL